MLKTCLIRAKTGVVIFTILILSISFGLSETCQSLTSTTPVQQWTATFGGALVESADSVIQTSDGGYAFSGPVASFSQSPGKISIGYQSKALFFGKVDMYGKMQFNRTINLYEKIGNFSKTFLVQNKNNSYSIACCSADFSLIGLDSSGNVITIKTYPGTGDLSSFILTNDGGYAMVGNRFAIKTDSSGNMKWNKTNWGNTGGSHFSIIQTVDGGYAIGGGLIRSNALTAEMEGYYCSLIKLDSSGNTQWDRKYDKRLSIPYNEFLVQTKDGGYALACSVGKNATSITPYSYWLAKTDSNGIIQWNNTFLSSYYTYPRAFVQDQDGGFAIAGAVSDIGTNCWVIRTDSSGVAQGNKSFGTMNDYVLSMSRTTDGGYILAGINASNAYGNSDFLLVKIAPLIPVLDHFDFDWIGYQSSGKPFNITVRAKNQYGDTFPSYTGSNSLSSSNGTVKPTTIGPFVNGVWTGSITFNTTIVTTSNPNQYLYLLTLGGGKLAQSNPIFVVLSIANPTLPAPTKLLPRGDEFNQSPNVSTTPSGLDSMTLLLIIAVGASICVVILAIFVYLRKKAQKDSKKTKSQ
jgi:hypothetical protein